MKLNLPTLSLSLALIAAQPIFSASGDAAYDAAKAKFEADMKTSVMSGAITIPQVRELKANADTLKASRQAQRPGAPVDLMTPYHAVSNIKRVMASLPPRDRETLHGDLEAMLAAQALKNEGAAPPPTSGEKLGKDIFKAVMAGNPTDSQVMQLQDSLNSLQKIKGDQERPLQALRSMKKSKSDIEQVMNSGSFRPEDRSAVLDDLNSLGPQGGGRRR